MLLRIISGFIRTGKWDPFFALFKRMHLNSVNTTIFYLFVSFVFCCFLFVCFFLVFLQNYKFSSEDLFTCIQRPTSLRGREKIPHTVTFIYWFPRFFINKHALIFVLINESTAHGIGNQSLITSWSLRVINLFRKNKFLWRKTCWLQLCQFFLYKVLEIREKSSCLHYIFLVFIKFTLVRTIIDRSTYASTCNGYYF